MELNIDFFQSNKWPHIIHIKSRTYLDEVVPNRQHNGKHNR
jgi:hypothetical protein